MTNETNRFLGASLYQRAKAKLGFRGRNYEPGEMDARTSRALKSLGRGLLFSAGFTLVGGVCSASVGDYYSQKAPRTYVAQQQNDTYRDLSENGRLVGAGAIPIAALGVLSLRGGYNARRRHEEDYAE